MNEKIQVLEPCDLAQREGCVWAMKKIAEDLWYVPVLRTGEAWTNEDYRDFLTRLDSLLEEFIDFLAAEREEVSAD